MQGRTAPEQVWANLVLILPLFLSHSWSWMKLLERTSSKFSSSCEILWFTSLTNCKTIHSLVLISLCLCGSGSWLHTYIRISKFIPLCLYWTMSWSTGKKTSWLVTGAAPSNTVAISHCGWLSTWKHVPPVHEPYCCMWLVATVRTGQHRYRTFPPSLKFLLDQCCH